ncbi:MAG: RDD family protein [Clostridia bacterium]|nr:RDD family protein [Clostridia bacterium]
MEDIKYDSDPENRDLRNGLPDTENVPQIRPWVRYFARSIDLSLFSLAVGFGIGFFYPDLVEGSVMKQRMVQFVMLFGWFFVEAFLFFTWGTTLGKWLLRTHVYNAQGKKLGYTEALNRGLMIWFRGLGVGFLSFITTIIAYFTLTNRGTTSWDRDGGYIVVHKKIGALRIALVVLYYFLLLGYIFLTLLASVPIDQLQRFE